MHRLAQHTIFGPPEKRKQVISCAVPEELRQQSQMETRSKRVECAAFDGAGTSGDKFSLGALWAIYHAIHKHLEVNLKLIDMDCHMTTRNPHHDIHKVKKFMGSAKICHIEQALLAMADSYPQLKKRYCDQNLLKQDVKAIFDIFSIEGKEIIRKFSKPIPGMIEMQEELKKRNIKQVLQTAYNKEEADVFAAEMKKHGVVFSHQVTSNDVMHSRPFPSMLDKVKDSLGIEDRECILVFGDTKYDARAACKDYFFIGMVEFSAETGIVSLEEHLRMTPAELSQAYKKAEDTLTKEGAHFLIRPGRPMAEQLGEIIDEVEKRLNRREQPSLRSKL